MSATEAVPARAADELFRIPEAAWSHPLGAGCDAVGHPRVSTPMIDDGPWAGVPIGGIGAGSIGPTQRGDFARWHLRVGRHVFRPQPACTFAVFVDDPAGASQAHVLSTLRPSEGPTTWGWDLPEGAGTYRALFPRAWTVLDWERLPVAVAGSQLSPVLPGNVQETSYPVGVFEWRAHNPTDRPIRVGFLLSWQALDEDASGTPAGAAVRTRRAAGTAGAVLRSPASGDDPGVEFAILGTADGSGTVTTHGRFAVHDGAALWADFAADGALDGTDDPRPAGTGESIGAAVAVTLDLPPGETGSARFAVAWDIPVMRFGGGRGWYRRYTRFFGREGGRAWDIAAEGLARHREWEGAIEAWQAPLLADPGRPDWYVMALLNELYILVDGESAWEDGEVGGPAPREGEGRFAFLECYDYPFYDTHDVLFYASWATLRLWPTLERSMLRSLVASVPVADPATVTIEATGAVAVRKEPGAVPHDVGAPSEDPWLRYNAYAFQDPNRWKDLASKFVLQLRRDAHHLGEPELLRDAWLAVRMAMDRLAATDADGDGLPDHDGHADQTFDTWTMRGPSAYAGGLWLAALAAAESIAREVGDAAAAETYRAIRERGTASYRARLWDGDRLRYDGSGGPHSDSVMADQLCGSWWASTTGLPMPLEDAQVRAALDTIVRLNVRGFAGGRMGAVNGMRPDGSVDDSSEQSQEVWPGVSYTLAATLLHWGLDEAAWLTAEGTIRTTWERGLWFRTPEAWDSAGDFRASLYMRPLAIWALEHELEARRRGTARGA